MPWFRVVAFGPTARIASRSEDEAWDTWYRVYGREFPEFRGREDLLGTAIAASSARVVRRKTRTSALDADVSEPWSDPD